MKAIFTVSGFITLPGKKILRAKQVQEIDFTRKPMDMRLAQLLLLEPRFPFKDSALIDLYEKEVKVEGEITANHFSELYALFNAKEVLRLDLSQCQFTDPLFSGEGIKSLLDSLKLNFKVQEIRFPEDYLKTIQDEDKAELQEYLLRNKAIQKLNPWYANPASQLSPAKLIGAALLISIAGAVIGLLSIVTLFTLSSLYILGAAVAGNHKEKKLENALLRDKALHEEQSEKERQAISLGEKSRADWQSFSESFYPRQENIVALECYPTFLVGAVRAEMNKLQSSVASTESSAPLNRTTLRN